MCELLGLSARVPTSVGLSMSVLARHGSHTARLDDGWGIAFHAGDDALLVKQPGAADESPWIGFLAEHATPSRIVISHIRHATQGEISLRNTQPFMRELGGRMHIFAHNGRLVGIEHRLAGSSPRFRPVGSTDSEVAFCLLLARLAPLWDAGVPSVAQRLQEVRGVASIVRKLGPANFLYSDGDLLIAHAHRRTQRDCSIGPPGLWMLQRTCAVDGDTLPTAGVMLENSQQVTLFASVPLTGEAWRRLREGEIVVVRDGMPLTPPQTP